MLLKGQNMPTAAAPLPKTVEKPEVEPETDMDMEEENESQEDILERQVALSIP
jgi:hypothetical protein